jgi:nucleotide-binding universal stress UspA family protein
VKVLIALDDSPVSARAAREAVRLFSAENCEFLVVSVASLPVVWAGSAGFGMVAPLPMDQAWFEAAQPDDDELAARAQEAGIVDAEVHTATGDAVSVICKAADDHDVDVIVVGSHDKSVWRRILDPSVAAGIVRETYRPVLVVSGTPPS